MREEIVTDFDALGEGVAFVQEGVPKPVPISAGVDLFEKGFVLCDVGNKRLCGAVVERRMGPGVIAERLASSNPLSQQLDLVGVFLDAEAVHEAVDGRHVLCFQCLEDGADGLGTVFAGGQRTVGGEVVKGEGYLRRGGRSRGFWGSCRGGCLLGDGASC
jgi:hypothetical protein